MAIRTLYADAPQWGRAGARLDELLHGADFRIIKKTPRTLAGVAAINHIDVFVKRVSNNSWLKGAFARVCGSRARKAIRGALLLRRAGFSHPELIAAFEQLNSGSVMASYVITEYLRRPKVLSRFALADGRDFGWRRSVSERLAQTIRNLHASGCYTLDLQETNLLLEGRGTDVKIYFTDLEDYRWLPLVPSQFRLRNLVQLDRSIGRFVSRTHRLRFLHNYLGNHATRAEVRMTVARLHRIRLRVERHRRNRRHLTAIVTPGPDRSSRRKCAPFSCG
jgi:tRNA A-37 threonylcarbamoyl transferase component Bud32